MRAHLFPFPIWDKILEMIPPLFWQVAVFNGSYFSPFHLSISLKSESPMVAQCEAVIVSVPFCPTRRPAFCMWKDPERRRERWINTQTAFCLRHFGFCCHETQRHRHADNRWGRGRRGRRGLLNYFCLCLSENCDIQLRRLDPPVGASLTVHLWWRLLKRLGRFFIS